MQISLNEKVAIITGGARGIGKAIAIKYAKAGANILVADIIKEVESCGEEIVKESKEKSIKVQGIRVDITNSNDVEKMVKKAINEFGKIDILVNNAGIGMPTMAFWEVTEEIWDKVLSVNLKGTWLCSKMVVPYMIKQKSGKIINIGSFVAFQGGIIKYSSPYVASKAGVIALTKAMALELAPYGINVNSISPGTTLTHMTEALYSDPNLKEEILKYVPFKRPAMPEDIANAALFLASDMASYITGINLIVDGGWTAGTPYTLPRQYKPK